MQMTMQTTRPAYFTAYRSLKMNRDALGVVVVEFHTNGAPLTFTAQESFATGKNSP
jgi:hypothetical protein